MSSVAIHQEPIPVSPISQDHQPPTLLAYLRAVESGADLQRLEKLMDLHERHEANQSRKAFEQAMSDFRGEAMVILKSKHVDIAGGAKFNHAQLADVCDAVIPNMSKYGLRHRWKTEQEPGKITVTCIVSHRLGHCEPTTLFGPPDTAGNKSAIHAVASTVSLLERYTLLAAVGLAAREMDSNPMGTGMADPVQSETAPSDYADWKADTQAIADEGRERLLPHWEKSPSDLRRWAVSHDKGWWDDCKAKADRVSRKSKAAS